MEINKEEIRNAPCRCVAGAVLRHRTRLLDSQRTGRRLFGNTPKNSVVS